MSISEISAARADPPRSRARTRAMAACAFGPGAERMLSSSSSERPLMMGTGGATASRSSPRSRASSSSQCRRPACTRVKGRRSSTRMVTRSGSSRMTSARRIWGSASRRARTVAGSRRRMLMPSGISASARISSTGTRAAPSTWIERTARRGVVRSHDRAAHQDPDDRSQPAHPLHPARQVDQQAAAGARPADPLPGHQRGPAAEIAQRPRGAVRRDEAAAPTRR